jgi:hypothetical protein
MDPEDEDKQLRAVALQNVQSILFARQRAEKELIETKEALEEETRILELLNKTGAALASNLDLHGLVGMLSRSSGTREPRPSSPPRSAAMG